MTSASPIPSHADQKATARVAVVADVNDQDAFLGFIEYARSTLWPEDEEKKEDEEQQNRGELDDREAPGVREYSCWSQSPPWSWIVSRVLKTCIAFPSGVTSAILLSDLYQGWIEQNRHLYLRTRTKRVVPSRKRRQRKRLSTTVTIDSIYEKNFLSLDAALEVVILDAFILPGTNIYMLSLGDIWSSCTIDLYLHRRYYYLVNSENGILRKGREIFLTGCRFRSAIKGHGHPRLLPTEYLVILLDEDQDEDAILLGAQFCSDSFASITVDAFKAGFLYAFYARIESIGPMEVQVNAGSVNRKQITLIDGDGIRIKFLLWGEQVLLANLFSVGSMLAVDNPFIASSAESNVEACGEVCLEYGSDTHVYLVPFVVQEEPVLLNSTQIRFQGSRILSASDQSSRMSMPLDYGGSIDLKNYPFQSYVTDLRDKMTGISLYGVVTSIYRLREANFASATYSMTIKDSTGEMMIKLHFLESWSLGRVSCGHAIYISGLACSINMENELEGSWFEKDPGAFLVSLSCLPAVPNSSCLHKLSCLSDLSSEIYKTHICTVRLDQIEHHHVNSRLAHAVCGHFVDDKSNGALTCDFCSCDGEIVRNFDLKVIIADDSAKVSAWCSGPTAAEMLQICPDDFYILPEDEQAMYIYTLENERFLVVLVNCKPLAIGDYNSKCEAPWEIVHVQKN